MIGQEQRILSTDDRKVTDRIAPFVSRNIAATTSGSAETLHTVESGQGLEVSSLSVTNITSTAATLTMHVVPDGGAIGSGNAVLVGYSIPANTAVNIADIIGGFWSPGDMAQIWSGTANALTISGYYRQVY